MAPTRVLFVWGRTFLSVERARQWLAGNGYTPDPEDSRTVPHRYLSDDLVAQVVFSEGIGGAPDTWNLFCYHGAEDNFDRTSWDDDDDDVQND
jgi:hypothetical protein